METTNIQAIKGEWLLRMTLQRCGRPIHIIGRNDPEVSENVQR